MPARTLIQASPDHIAGVRERRRKKAELEQRKLARTDVFAKLGYEPNCRRRHDVRVAAAAALGIGDPFSAEVAAAVEGMLPPPCGLCPQELFHAATEFDVLFGGSAGGGKSRALTAEAIRSCVKHPGIRVGAFRRTYPELEESLLAELAEMSFATQLGAAWNGTRHELRFPNGSLLMFRYAETLQDATRRQGGQYQLLIFDERTLTPPNVISFLESRLRSGRADVPVLGIRSSSNPGGAGHGAVKKKYITGTEHGAKVLVDKRGRTVRFIPSRLSDNPHVNQEYAADLGALDDQMRAAFLDGNWDMFAGQMFPMLNHDRHVIQPFEIPATWSRQIGVDWGYANPWAVVWSAFDEDGRAYFYREIYKAGVAETDQALQILAAEASGEEISARFADDAMWASRGGDAVVKPIAEVYAENGVALTRASKGSRVNGWERVRSYVKDGAACVMHRDMGWATCPMAHFFTTVPELFRTLSDLPHATKGDPEDADSSGEDHLPDAARYLLINQGAGPRMVDPGDAPSNLLDGVEVMEKVGQFARRPQEDALYGDRPEGAGTVRLSPFA